MGEWIGRRRKARRAYGFDEIAIVPGNVTLNPDEVDITWKVGDITFDIPFMAAAMDGVVDPAFAALIGKFGGFGILNLEGIYTRYDDPQAILSEIVQAPPEKATELVQRLYQPPIKEELIPERIREIKKDGAPAVVSCVPQLCERYGPIAQEAGADIFVIQSTVTTAKHISKAYKSVDLAGFIKKTKMPVIIGNCVSYEATLELMETNPDGILIGVGPGAACTTRGVLGVGVPQVTATVDAACARDFHFQRTGKYIPIITDGGMSSGGDVCKAFAAGADAVVLGSALAKAKESPGKGFHWGMATPHHNLPRGTRIFVGCTSTLEEILFGPARLDDGSQNFVGALRTCMGYVGAENIRGMHLAELVIAPAIKTEGKIFQKAQQVGMGK